MPANCQATSGTKEPVWRIEIQTRSDDPDRLPDAAREAHSLKYGRYQRNSTVSGVGAELGQPEENSTTTLHVKEVEVGATGAYPMVQLLLSIEWALSVLQTVMDAVRHAHYNEKSMIYVREEWASRAAYDPVSDNRNRFWNDGRGLPRKVHFSFDVY